MKIFDDNSGWGAKVNFVDNNNMFVGYDLSQSCCEYAGWFIDDKVNESIPDELPKTPETDGYNFDPFFFEEKHDSSSMEEGGMAVFRLVRGDDDLYLHIFNSHNGYYVHGFEVKHGGEVVRESIL